MAMNFTTIKNTGQETIIHFEATDASFATISLASLTASTQARNSDAPRVNIVRFVSTGEDGAVVIVSRNNKNIIACAPENAPFLDLPAMGITESIQNNQDIKIENKVAKAVSGYITLRKVAGWSGKLETAEFGSYDNESVVGS
jgi:hypothetical protein